MLVLKQCMENTVKQNYLLYTFPRLTESHQQYVLGLAEGIKHIQRRYKKTEKTLKKAAVQLLKNGS